MRLPPSSSFSQLRVNRTLLSRVIAPVRSYAITTDSIKPAEPGFAPYDHGSRPHLLTLNSESQTIGKILEKQSYLPQAQISKMNLLGDAIVESDDNTMRISAGDYVRIRGCVKQ